MTAHGKSTSRVQARPVAKTIIAKLAIGAAAVLGAGAVLAQSPAPEKLSWYGDPKAPDLSGVWIRADGPTTGSASHEGWLPWPPPLKGAFATTWKRRVAETAAGTRKDDPVSTCLPPGMPRFITGTTGPMLIIQTPGRMMLYRDGIPVRRIWLDGRPLPAAKDLESFSNGNAHGHYEGKDLVTEIAGVRDQPIDATGVPHSDDLKIVERFHRLDEKTLRIVVMLTDKTAFSKPMTSTVTYTRFDDPMWEPREFLCTPGSNYHPERYVR